MIDSSDSQLVSESLEMHMTMWFHNVWLHYDDIIMGTIASQITSLTIVYSTVYSGADQNKHQSSASLAFVWGIHRGPVNSPHKWPVTRKMFPFDDVIMIYQEGVMPAASDQKYWQHYWMQIPLLGQDQRIGFRENWLQGNIVSNIKASLPLGGGLCLYYSINIT